MGWHYPREKRVLPKELDEHEVKDTRAELGRLAKRKTIQGAADAIGYSKNHVSGVINGRIRPGAVLRARLWGLGK